MRCIKNLEDIKMWGDFDTNKASNLMVVFQKCDSSQLLPGQKCKTEAEIEKWMESKYIVTLENESKFISHKFEERRIKSESVTRYYPLNY